MQQLRIRTEYTFGQTYAPIKKIVQRLKAIGTKQAAIVDFCSTWGHVEWEAECIAAGIEPLFGVELVVSDDDEETTMGFIAKSPEGLSELYRMSTQATGQKLQTKRRALSRLYRDDVRAMSPEILKLSGSVTNADFLREVGAVIEFNPASMVGNVKRRAIVNMNDLRFCVTSDNSYGDPKERKTFQLMNDFGVKTTKQHILDQKELEAVLSGLGVGIPDPIDLTSFRLRKARNLTVPGDLREMCMDGVLYRKNNNGLKWTKAYKERLDYELKLIASKDFDSYFIVVADMCRYAKSKMLVGPSRGSAAGSLVCYLLRITEIDPMSAGLMFERFIDITRKDYPDIDLDFADDKRLQVFDYMAEKYGSEQTAHIGTILRYKPRSALAQVCKRLNIPIRATESVKSSMIERSIADSRANDCLRDTLETTEAGKELMRDYPQAIEAADIEGHASHTGTHAAGLLVSNDRINDFCTIDLETNVAQLDKYDAEALNILKIDVLGLKALTVLDQAVPGNDWYALQYDDPEVYATFNKGLLSGIFQFEGNAMRQVCGEIRPLHNIDDIDAVTALARPGPFAGRVTQQYIERRAGRERYQAIHPLVERFMSNTQGLPLYQEQTMAIVREIGKFDWEQTAAIRKGISKRSGKEYFDKLWGAFEKGAAENGLSPEQTHKIWEMINVMGSWQMNKAHTYSYAVLSYWAAWAKTHYPMSFAIASLSHESIEDKALIFLREQIEAGLPYSPFDPEVCGASWSCIDGKLMSGLVQRHGYGPAKADKYLKDREAGKLSPEAKAKAAAAPCPFDDIWPIETEFGDYYVNPKKYGIINPIVKLKELDGSQDGTYCFIARIVKKNPRNFNEQVLVNKRGGVVGTGQLEFLDLQLRDDTDVVFARVHRRYYLAVGKELFDRVPVGAVVLFKANLLPDMRFPFIQKWKVLRE